MQQVMLIACYTVIQIVYNREKWYKIAKIAAHLSLNYSDQNMQFIYV